MKNLINYFEIPRRFTPRNDGCGKCKTTFQIGIYRGDGILKFVVGQGLAPAVFKICLCKLNFEMIAAHRFT